MLAMNDLVCEIYTDVDISQSELADDLAELLNGTVLKKIWPNLVVLPSIDEALAEGSAEANIGPYIGIEVHRHEQFDEFLRREFPDGFLHFRHRIEVFANEKQSPSLVRNIGRILEYLWAKSYPAVAACDFEEQLPYRGGYKSRDVPWVKV